ncbi:uncharacterized protein ACMZJ9_016834 [Mantella aurantiaca]
MMRNVLRLLFGLSVLWVSGTSCLPARRRVPENPLSHNRTLRGTSCGEGEYSYQDWCCQKCPAGSYVADHCTRNHQPSECQPCSLGQDFTSSSSGIESCESCRVCRQDEVPVSECTLSRNAVCQCKPGTYCIPGDVCEICMSCLRCGDGKRVKEECTATKNTVCEEIPKTRPAANPTSADFPPTTLTKVIQSTPEKDVTTRENRSPENEKQSHNNNQSLFTNNSTDPSANSSCTSLPQPDRANQGVADPLMEGAPLLASSTVSDYFNSATEPTEHPNTLGIQSTEDSGPGGDDSGGGGGGAAQSDEPCSDCGQLPLCDCDWTTFIHSIFDIVPADYIIRLVRELRVPNNKIDYVLKDYPHDIYERNYKLFQLWRTLTGKQASMERVLSVLRSMEMGGLAEKIISSLRSKNIAIA